MIPGFPSQTIRLPVYNPRQLWPVDGLQSVYRRRMTKRLQPASIVAGRRVDAFFSREHQKTTFHASQALRRCHEHAPSQEGPRAVRHAGADG